LIYLTWHNVKMHMFLQESYHFTLQLYSCLVGLRTVWYHVCLMWCNVKRCIFLQESYHFTLQLCFPMDTSSLNARSRWRWQASSLWRWQVPSPLALAPINSMRKPQLSCLKSPPPINAFSRQASSHCHWHTCCPWTRPPWMPVPVGAGMPVGHVIAFPSCMKYYM
jgi:hypothetical protein